ncbi:MAG: alpha-galactosidase [Thermoflavifilum sp.]|nr:alpha-galactosidase [Thermoflavifilum sp.]
MYRTLLLICSLLVIHLQAVYAQAVVLTHWQHDDEQQFILTNDRLRQIIVLHKGILIQDILQPITAGDQAGGIMTDANFQLQLMWTGWRAPGQYFNGDLHVMFTAQDFRFDHADTQAISADGKAWQLYFKGSSPENPLLLRITYSLLPGKNYVRRQIAICDTTGQDHWLEAVASREGTMQPWQGEAIQEAGVRIESSMHVRATPWQPSTQRPAVRLIKKGEFGQPAAADFKQVGGVFMGIEYPAAVNEFTLIHDQQLQIHCQEWVGTTIGEQWTITHPVVEGLVPDHHVHLAFDAYLRDIQVAPDTPYLLYNSWYDLRSPAFTDVSPDHVMNEKNILRIIDQFNQNMVKPYGIHLNAFVLDDGWDDYASDWQLRRSTFPHGLMPIINALKPLHTRLGMWIGPTGGYSFRMQRINWMRAHGYETVGHGDHIMMDIAGPHYFGLLQKRLTDFARMGISYFKWDGLQFSSSEPDNHHPVGYFSEITALDHVIQLADTVRKINPEMYINITSGTWMSPWWLLCANQIWMQGADYGYATLPSFTDRDAAMTYKDMVLYDDFQRHDVWFPMSHVMTHGIIKAKLASVGATDDPLPTFANDVMLYFGRGVTMYEWYISPDMLQPDEWRILSQGLQWAKAHAHLLRLTYMIGGDPARGEAYGYVHFAGDSGIIVVRNPQMQPQTIRVKLDPAHGLQPEAKSLVVEQTYPRYWISGDLYSAGATLTLDLQGFETAIYAIYPLNRAHRPLLANAVFTRTPLDVHREEWHILDTTGALRWLNPEWVQQVSAQQPLSNIFDLHPSVHVPVLANGSSLRVKDSSVDLQFNLPSTTPTAQCIFFFISDSTYFTQELPHFTLQVDGRSVKPIIQQSPGQWAALSCRLDQPGHHEIVVQASTPGAESWRGEVTAWLTGQVQVSPVNYTIQCRTEIQHTPVSPSPYPANTVYRQLYVDKARIQLSR